MTTPPDTHTPDVAHLALRVDDLAAGLAQLAADVEDLSAALLPADLTFPDDDPPPDHAHPPGQGQPVPQPVYERLEDWVDQYFLPTFRRPIGGEIRWCAHWQDHAEAITRLEALWRSWEALRLDPNLGIATWLTTYLDPLLAVLLGRSGPFAQCTPERHA
jgi:hypothetical protein